MSDSERTPVHHETPMELVLRELHEIKSAVHGTFNLQLDLNQRFNALEARVTRLEYTRVWVPYGIAAAAFLVALLAFVRASGAMP